LFKVGQPKDNTKESLEPKIGQNQVRPVFLKNENLKKCNMSACLGEKIQEKKKSEL